MGRYIGRHLDIYDKVLIISTDDMPKKLLHIWMNIFSWKDRKNLRLVCRIYIIGLEYTFVSDDTNSFEMDDDCAVTNKIEKQKGWDVTKLKSQKGLA